MFQSALLDIILYAQQQDMQNREKFQRSKLKLGKQLLHQFVESKIKSQTFWFKKFNHKFFSEYIFP